MAALFPNATTYATLVSNDSDFRAVVWSKIFENTFRYRGKWRHFMGNEGSGMPITRKTDLEAGIAQDVVFNMVSPIGGQGKLGENLLRESTQAITESSFRVRVDLERQGVAYSQLINWLRNNLNPEQKAAELLSDWAVQKHDDNIQTVLRRWGIVQDPGNNLVRVGNRTTRNLLTSTDYISPSFIEQAKAHLMAYGATPIANIMQDSGAVVPKYLYYGHDSFIRPLRTNSTFLSTLQYGDVRGGENALFTGKYPMWDSNVIYPDEQPLGTDINGRQGTPLQPMAYLGTALTEGTSTTLTGGGTTDPAGTADYFANFNGYPWYITTSDTLPTDNNTYYAMIYNITGADAGKYEIVSYVTGGFSASGNTLTVTRGSTSDGAGNARALAAGRYQNTHPSGSPIVPCTSQGVPLGWAIHTGADALRYAVGMVENQRAEQLDDFGLDVGIATQTIRGMSVFQDRRDIAKNFVICEGATLHPLVSPVAYTGSN
jgi:N4-gp56 family major capsid protein